METSIFADKKIILTGGAGFIGSHVIEQIMPDSPENIFVLDNLSSTKSSENIGAYVDFPNFAFHQRDIRAIDSESFDFSDYDMIIHLAAQPSVPFSVREPYLDFEINVVGSLKLLELARKNDIKDFIFAASGGTMYGETHQHPTSENQSFKPISNYGAAKAATEMYLSSYAELYAIKATSLRFGNVYGPRSLHGVIHDFYVKLRKDPKNLHILGDGKQTKSYLYIDDCINGVKTAASRTNNGFDAYNIAAEPPTSVLEIAIAVCQNLKLDPSFHYTGGSKGWKGDVTYGNLSTDKLNNLGWKQEVDMSEGISKYLDWLKFYYQDPTLEVAVH